MAPIRPILLSDTSAVYVQMGTLSQVGHDGKTTSEGLVFSFTLWKLFTIQGSSISKEPHCLKWQSAQSRAAISPLSPTAIPDLMWPNHLANSNHPVITLCPFSNLLVSEILFFSSSVTGSRGFNGLKPCTVDLWIKASLFQRHNADILYMQISYQRKEMKELKTLKAEERMVESYSCNIVCQFEFECNLFHIWICIVLEFNTGICNVIHLSLAFALC